MLTVLGVLAALGVLFVAASVATREGDVLLDAPRDRADLDLPVGPLQPEDVGAVRLGMALRGYRMSEVDDLLDRVIAELADRDARLSDLENSLGQTPVRPADAQPADPQLADPQPADPIGGSADAV